MNATVDLDLPPLPANIQEHLVARATHPRHFGLIAVITSGGGNHLYLLQLVKGKWTEVYHRKIEQPVQKLSWTEDGKQLTLGNNQLTETPNGWVLR